MIRRLQAADVDQFILLRSKSIREEVLSFGSDPNTIIDGEKTIADLKQKDTENFILGNFINDELIGMLGAIRHQDIKRKHKAWIWGMYIHHEHRKKRIARRLMQSAIHDLSQLNGLEKIYLSVTSASEAAQELYKSLDFKVYGHEVNALQWDGIRLDEIFMELKI